MHITQMLHDYLSTTSKWMHMIVTVYIYRTQRFFLFRGRISSILVVRIASIGDVVRASVIIQLLKNKYPATSIDFLTSDIAYSVIENNPQLRNVYTVSDISRLPKYDWIINLQAPEPPVSFLQNSGASFTSILETLFNADRTKFITGRHMRGGKSIAPTIVYACQSEIEEIVFTALQFFKPEMVLMPKIYLDNTFSPSDEIKEVFQKIDWNKKCIGIFIGTNDTGGYDNGERTYSISYLVRLVELLIDKFTIILFGESSVKSEREKTALQSITDNVSGVINIVDKTNLCELLWCIDQMDLVISTDSGPAHLALGLEKKLIALFSNSSSFKMSRMNSSDHHAFIDAFRPCSKYVMEWKFFCIDCTLRKRKRYSCKYKEIVRAIDQIPVEKVHVEVKRLLTQEK